MISIPLKSIYSYSFSVILEQVNYRMKFNWSDKEDAWFFDIYSRSNEPLILGHKLLYNNSTLIKHHANSEVPQGEFILVAGESGELLRPTFNSISKGDVLYYATSDELA